MMRMFLKFVRETFLVLLLVAIACVYPLAVHLLMKMLGGNAAVMVIGVIAVPIIGFKLVAMLTGKFDNILAGGVPKVLRWLVEYIMVIHALLNVLSAYNYRQLIEQIYELLIY